MWDLLREIMRFIFGQIRDFSTALNYAFDCFLTVPFITTFLAETNESIFRLFPLPKMKIFTFSIFSAWKNWNIMI